jgi:hypothetical protein
MNQSSPPTIIHRFLHRRQQNGTAYVARNEQTRPRLRGISATTRRWMMFLFLAMVGLQFQTPFLCQAFCTRPNIHSTSPSQRFSNPETIRGNINLRLLSSHDTSTGNDHQQRLQDRINMTLDELVQVTTDDFHLDRQAILEAVNHQQAADEKASASVLPSEVPMPPNSIPYQWIYSPRTNRPFAIQTNEKILDSSTISWIRQQAHETWNDKTKTGMASRFTYQRKGNYEVHLADLLKHTTGHQQKEAIHQALTQRIYPVIREAFGDSLVDDPSSLAFRVYDAIVIRYNATEVGVHQENSIGAGQPLHRDLGLVSVNIMLNDEEEFDGGGTFFEHQLEDIVEGNGNDIFFAPQPLKPTGGPGHALMHLSSDRHAGASTTRGIRDILICFITASNTKNAGAAMLERAARLKSTARSSCQACEDSSNCVKGLFHSALWRACYQRLAVEAVPHDGEAWNYLGMALWDVHSTLLAMTESAQQTTLLHKHLIEGSIDCLKLASSMTPCDARLYNNLALLLDRVSSSPDLMALLTTEDRDDYHDQILLCYEKAVRLHKASQLGGCDVRLEYDAVILNYGLYLANQDLFEPAAKVLGAMNNSGLITQNDNQKDRHFQVLQDAQRLLHFCQRQL